jgi:hypothetical protein
LVGRFAPIRPMPHSNANVRRVTIPASRMLSGYIPLV